MARTLFGGSGGVGSRTLSASAIMYLPILHGSPVVYIRQEVTFAYGQIERVLTYRKEKSMRLESVRILRFRSIEDVRLENCGDFNVLIGKNNSGKSNILTAIYTFFSCIQSGGLITLDPSIGRSIDFYKRQTDKPIEITLGLSLSLAERDALVGAIATEAPQMRNAVEGMDPSLWLYATVRVTHPPKQYGYVSRLELGSSNSSAALNNRGTNKTILAIGNEAATELHKKLSFVRQQSKYIEDLDNFQQNIDADVWRRLSADNLRELSRAPLRTLLRSRQIPSELEEKISRILGESSSYQDFTTSFANLQRDHREALDREQAAPLRNKIGTFAGEQDTIPEYVTYLLESLASPKVLYLRERREPIGAAEAARLLNLKVQRGGTDILQSIQDTVSALLGVKIDAFASSVAVQNQPLAEMDVDNFLVEVNGAGVREALRLVLDVEFERPKILLVEEPEIHLHPALETSAMRFLKRISSTCQVFITTHSTNFLDTAEMHNVYLISKDDSSRVQQIDIDGAEAQIPEELGIRLSSLFMYDRLVFVEGASDEAILREWASKLDVNFGQANVGFITMGGVRNFVHFATEATLSFLSRRRVRMWFLIDRDEKNDADVVRMKEKLGTSATLKVLSRREIENYLLNARALAEFIATKQLEGGAQNQKAPSQQEIQRALEECVDAQKYLAVYKRVASIICRPILPRPKGLPAATAPADIEREITDQLDSMAEQFEVARAQVDELVREKLQQIDGEWPTRKFSIALGDKLLDDVCKRYGVRYKKERDSARLASFFTTNEIDSEIRGIIHEIGD